LTLPLTPPLPPLSLHDALPISGRRAIGVHRRPIVPCRVVATAVVKTWDVESTPDNHFAARPHHRVPRARGRRTVGSHRRPTVPRDRKSTRLNSSHRTISYAVFC